MFLTAWEWTTSSRTAMLRPWAVSMRYFKSSGVPKREQGAKKEETW